MYVLSVEDIDLMIALANNQKLPSEVIRHEKQMDKLISMGIIRPGGGVLALTELGHKTARGLMGRCLGSMVDGPTSPGSATGAPAGATSTPNSDANSTELPKATAASEGDKSAEVSSDYSADADTSAEPA